MKCNVRYLPLIITNTLLLCTIITETLQLNDIQDVPYRTVGSDYNKNTPATSSFGGVICWISPPTVGTTLAYYYGHVTHIIPYISDTGTLPPESCYFGQFLNIIWLLLSAAMYLKFRQVQDILSKHNMTHKNNLNKLTAIIGLIAAFGVSIVANFQETNMFIVHWIGAVMAFGGGTVYVCLQTTLYLTIAPVIGQMFLTKVRIGVSAVTVVSFLIYFIAAMISYTKFNGQNYLAWQKEDGGFEWHNTSTITEWICAISIMVYIMLMGDEFKTLTVYEPEIDVGLHQRSSS